MDELRRQVRRAHRRLAIQRLMGSTTWALFLALLIVSVAVAIPKAWHLGVDPQAWLWSWLGSGLGLGLLAAVLWTYFTRHSRFDAAIELDRRFRLKERVSSTLTLSESELATDAGQALQSDAARRVSQIDVSDQFRLQGRWWNLLPLAPAAVVTLLTFLVPDALPKTMAKEETDDLSVVKQVQRSADQLKRRLAEHRKLADGSGLEDARALFTELERDVGELTKAGAAQHKQALVKLNSMADEIRSHRAQFGTADELRNQFKQLRSFHRGPADQVARALKRGDLATALKELDSLQQRLTEGKMSEKEREQLAAQLDQLAKKMNRAVDGHRQAREELAAELERAKQAGGLAKAGELQNQLDQLAAQAPHLRMLEQMASRLEDSAQSLERNDLAQAAKELQAMVASLGDVQAELEQLDMLDAALDQVASAKNAMSCSKCQGEGCELCQGFDLGDMMESGSGLSEGQGRGARPEAETDSQFYSSRVRGEMRQGRGLVTGFVGGANLAGDSLEEVKQAIESAAPEADDPLTSAKLPRDHRAHARQYFDSLRRDQ
jgi:hypothetical protein